jgi:hypothetical protein
MIRKENIVFIVILGAILIWALFINKPRHADTIGGNGVPPLSQTVTSQ